MNQPIDDPLWPHFKQLWPSLRDVEPSIVLAGGYGLLLKQLWLSNNVDARMLVPVHTWPDAHPRATKDIDIIIGLELIANRAAHAHVLAALADNHFVVGAHENDKRWRYMSRYP